MYTARTYVLDKRRWLMRVRGMNARRARGRMPRLRLRAPLQLFELVNGVVLQFELLGEHLDLQVQRAALVLQPVQLLRQSVRVLNTRTSATMIEHLD